MRLFLWEILGSIFLLFVMSLFSPKAHAQAVNLDIICSIESNWNAKAISFAGAKYGRGVAQVSEIALKDWNQCNKRDRYTERDLFNPQVNMKIANWLLEYRIPQLLKAQGLPITEENIVAGYNAGVGNVRRWRYIIETLNYVNKYKKLKSQL